LPSENTWFLTQLQQVEADAQKVAAGSQFAAGLAPQPPNIVTHNPTTGCQFQLRHHPKSTWWSVR